MPAQLGQLANFNFPAYIPQRRPGVGEELLAGIVGQIAKNHMSPDYSPELAERGIEGVDNNWFTKLTGGNRANVDDFNSISRTANAEATTADQVNRTDIQRDDAAARAGYYKDIGQTGRDRTALAKKEYGSSLDQYDKTYDLQKLLGEQAHGLRVREQDRADRDSTATNEFREKQGAEIDAKIAEMNNVARQMQMMQLQSQLANHPDAEDLMRFIPAEGPLPSVAELEAMLQQESEALMGSGGQGGPEQETAISSSIAEGLGLAPLNWINDFEDPRMRQSEYSPLMQTMQESILDTVGQAGARVQAVPPGLDFLLRKLYFKDEER